MELQVQLIIDRVQLKTLKCLPLGIGKPVEISFLKQAFLIKEKFGETASNRDREREAA